MRSTRRISFAVTDAELAAVERGAAEAGASLADFARLVLFDALADAQDLQLADQQFPDTAILARRGSDGD